MTTTKKLTKRQRAALVETIKLWELKRDGLLPIAGKDNCALCWEFLPGCLGCPVMQETDMRYCYDTPYYTARHAAKVSDPSFNSADGTSAPVVCNEEARAGAVEELNFLRRILKRRDGEMK